jgi:hypothetical protein
MTSNYFNFVKGNTGWKDREISFDITEKKGKIEVRFRHWCLFMNATKSVLMHGAIKSKREARNMVYFPLFSFCTRMLYPVQQRYYLINATSPFITVVRLFFRAI